MGINSEIITSNNQNAHSFQIQGIIFDLDGTIIRSVVDFPKMKSDMIHYIDGLDLQGTNYTIKHTTNEIITDLNKKMVNQNILEDKRNNILEEISEILTKVEFENIDKVELLPGVKEFISYCFENKIKMVILTRASEKYTNEALKRMEIIEYFLDVVTRDDFTLLRAKPHIHALNYVIDRLGLSSENIIFVGDHKIDHMCAEAGNIRFVGVLEGAYNRQMLSELNNFRLVKDFHELLKLVKEING